MEIDYFELPNTEWLDSITELTIQRSSELVTAIERHRDTNLVGICRTQKNEPRILESIIIDIECDGIPPNNKYGIKYCERLALVISDDPQQLVEVLALRKDFPELIHQNDSPDNFPRNLCLYFESPISVLRTWTPQNFLKRIKWWLEASARNTLHLPEQPAEQLFFSTMYELILPWDYEDLRKDQNTEFSIVAGSLRKDKGCSFSLEKGMKNTLQVELLEVVLPTVIHGSVLRNPNTLGDLHEQLSNKGVDLLKALVEKTQIRVGSQGVKKSEDSEYTVFLLHIPLAKAKDTNPEKVVQKAFVTKKGFLKLGEEIGSLVHSENVNDTYYVDHMGTINTSADSPWRDDEIFAMEVLIQNNRERSRYQSGIDETGPKAILLGAGSLGGSMLDIWVRSGWGEWTVIDKDYIKPHNLSRHVAYTQHIGEQKSKVLQELASAASANANPVNAICADVLDLSDKDYFNNLCNAELIVDVSTTLEYPRFASEYHELPRHVSTYITPNGQSAVLFVEDQVRKKKLRTLEAQYYREIINNNWGDEHFGLEPESFWSGASCRDLSFKLPFSTILSHAGNLVENIQSLIKQDDAFVGIWNRDRISGSVDFYALQTYAEQSFRIGDYYVYIDDGLVNKINKFRQDNLPKETGGILLGYYDFNIKSLVVVDAFPAPQDSNAGVSWFERGTEGLATSVDNAANRTTGIVTYIGEWHSHPDGCSVEPSNDDILQLTELAIGMEEDGLPGVIVIVGKDNLNVLQGVLAR